MKICKLLVLLTASMILNSCELVNHEYDCEAIVVGNINEDFVTCTEEIWNLKITKDIDIVQSLFTEKIDYTDDTTYAALNLPDELRAPGLTIKLDIRKPGEGEMPACHNFEMPVLLGPTIYVTRAEEK